MHLNFVHPIACFSLIGPKGDLTYINVSEINGKLMKIVDRLFFALMVDITSYISCNEMSFLILNRSLVNEIDRGSSLDCVLVAE